jgi:hypothetical protein
MDDKKPPIEIKTLKEGSTVTIEIPTALYSRLQSLLMVGIPFTDLESAMKVLNTITNSQEDPDAATFHTRTLLYLIARIEEAAEKQGVLETKMIDRVTGKPI